MNLVLCRYHGAPPDPTAVSDDDSRAITDGDVWNAQPYLPSERHAVPKLDIGSSGAFQVAGVMHRNIVANRRERIGPSDPQTAKFVGYARKCCENILADLFA